MSTSTTDRPKVYLYRRIVQAKLYIDKHYAEHIDLDDISNEAALSKFHFIRLFKKIYNSTPHRYLRKVRLDQARLLMTTSDNISIEEVCLKVGFESVGTFSSMFKREFGITPGALKKQLIDRQIKIKAQPLGYVPGCFAKSYGWS